MGVIFVVHEAMKRGFVNGHPDWSNLGQGQPEVGPMESAPERIADVHIEPEDHAYGPLEGIPELRDAVAAHYNRLYRKSMKSQYSAENVCIAQGGRLALSRAMIALGATSVGYQTPDYAAYEDMFNLHLPRIDTHLVRRGRRTALSSQRGGSSKSFPRETSVLSSFRIPAIPPERFSKATSSSDGSRSRAASVSRCFATSSTATSSTRQTARRKTGPSARHRISKT